MEQNSGSYELEQYVNKNPLTVSQGVEIINGFNPFNSFERIMSINPGCGFGSYNKSYQEIQPFLMRVSDNLDYEISFWFKQSMIAPSIHLSVDAFNCYGVPKKVFSEENGLQENTFIRDGENVISLANKWYFARFILFNQNKSINIDSKQYTSLCAGRNLIMEKKTTNILVNLYSNNSKLFMWNFKVKPLRTPFSTGFIQGGQMLELFRKNNNKVLDDKQVDSISANMLLGYNTANVTIKL